MVSSTALCSLLFLLGTSASPLASRGLAGSFIETTPVEGGTAGDYSYGNVMVPQMNDGCCGYKLSAFEDRYYPDSLRIDFSTIADGTDLASLGFKVVDGEGVGSPSDTQDGYRAVGSSTNVWISGGLLHLKVPGGQGDIPHPTAAEIQLAVPVTAGAYRMKAKIDKTVGTCHSMFTYHRDPDLHDEIDIELTGNKWVTEGLQFSTYNPDSSNNGVWEGASDSLADSFNWFTIGWWNSNGDDYPRFYINDEERNGPGSQFKPVHPSTLTINHWSNNDPSFTGRTPDQDVELQISQLEFFYQTADHSTYPAWKDGCSADSACSV
ncbi:hypothetical protein IAU60_004676 [Kwoniella sp. DSM 27419]